MSDSRFFMMLTKSLVSPSEREMVLLALASVSAAMLPILTCRWYSCCTCKVVSCVAL